MSREAEVAVERVAEHSAAQAVTSAEHWMQLALASALAAGPRERWRALGVHARSSSTVARVVEEARIWARCGRSLPRSDLEQG